MQGRNYIIIILLIIALFPFYLHELQRYKFCLQDCTDQFGKDVALLDRDVCINPHDRLNFHAMVDCQGAERRIQTSPRSCALHKWRSDSQIMHIWNILTESYWSMLFIIIPLIMWMMWLSSKSSQEDKWMQLLSKGLGKQHKKKKFNDDALYIKNR